MVSSKLTKNTREREWGSELLRWRYAKWIMTSTVRDDIMAAAAVRQRKRVHWLYHIVYSSPCESRSHDRNQLTSRHRQLELTISNLQFFFQLNMFFFIYFSLFHYFNDILLNFKLFYNIFLFNVMFVYRECLQTTVDTTL